jgi:MYXO-CTERM domain-containing protein
VFLGLLGLLSPAAFAFAPSQEEWIGIEPSRMQSTRGWRQSVLRDQPAWGAFLEGDGYGWQARFDERTGTPLRAWGPGIDMGTLRTSKDVEGALRNFFGRNAALIGVPLDQLRLKSANHVARTDTWYVDFDRMVGDAPIWRGGVTARIKQGKLLLVGVETYPELNGVEPAKLTANNAITVAALAGPASMAVHTEESARLVVLPREEDGALHYTLTWEVRSRTAEPVGKWVSHVDARTGELLNVYNEVRFLDGILYATHDTRTVDGNFTTSGMPLATLTGGTSGSSVTTGLDGSFSVDGAESWSTRMRGTYAVVRNEGGSNASYTFTGDAAPTWSSSNADQAEIDTYVFLHDVRAWGLLYAPEIGIVSDAINGNVNLDSTCNAYYDGESVNFYQAGDGCNNTGRIADVVYHEWGHGFHYTSLEAGDFDGSISEGIGDITAALQTLDPLIAPYFGTSGAGIRELETNYTYPDDITGEVHQDGLIFAGAVWDLYLALTETYGEPVGEKGRAWAVTSQLLADSIKAGPTIDESYDEMIFADDDNGDLSDGTPHQCELIDAFAMHGLGPGGDGGSLLALDHSAVGNQLAGVAVPLAGDLVNLSPACVSFTVDTIAALYSTDGGGSWESATLSVVGDRFEGDLPEFPAGTVVSYYLQAEADDGSEVSLPAGGEIAPFMFYVGELEELYCETFSDDGGYTHALLDGTDQRGADDWIFGSPEGYADDPEDAYSGREVWGNDLGGGDYNGAYQPDIVNRLSSPAIDVSGNTQVVVQFRRWLNVEDGVYDQARVYANDDLLWTNYETSDRDGTAQTEDRAWMLHTLLVDTDGDSLTLGWEIASDGGLEFGGWNIDDVCVYRVAEATAASYEIDDFVASDDQEERVDLTWTQPDDARATDAVVVRRDDRFPENKDDGTVVWTGSATPGEAMSGADGSAGGYYAVFAGGEDGWLVGATEGENADQGAAVDGNGDGLYTGGDEDGVIIKGGCGCASGSGAPAGGALLAAASLLGLVRRRRQA